MLALAIPDSEGSCLPRSASTPAERVEESILSIGIGDRKQEKGNRGVESGVASQCRGAASFAVMRS